MTIHLINYADRLHNVEFWSRMDRMGSMTRADRKLPPSNDPLGEILHLLRLTGTLWS